MLFLLLLLSEALEPEPDDPSAFRVVMLRLTFDGRKPLFLEREGFLFALDPGGLLLLALEPSPFPPLAALWGRPFLSEKGSKLELHTSALTPPPPPREGISPVSRRQATYSPK